MRPDPLDSLHRPSTPAAPRPEFAAELRRRVEDALAAPTDPTTTRRTAAMTTTTTVPTVATPYLAVHDAAEALAFYRDAFGAREAMRIEEPDGRIGHAEFHVGEAVFMLSDEFPDQLAVSPRTLGGSPVMIHLQVPDVDATVERAVEAGATLLRPPADQFHGNRNGVVVDPYGHRWMISTPAAGDRPS